MSDHLSPERLGLAGESKFTNLCDLANLTCNKSNRDETGWDFLVEFPMAAAGPALTLDQRAPVVCHVQLKTTAGNLNRVSIKLSALERLAKNVRPALIVVFVSRPNGDVLTGYAIHLLDAPLAQILKRLRRAHADGRLDINRARLSFDYRRDGTPFEVTPVGLRRALAQACGPDAVQYVRQKQAQLEELGYGDDRYQGEALFHAEGPTQLNNILLGLEPLRPEKFSLYESRFGIRIPLQDPAPAGTRELFIQPPMVGACKITVRGPPLSLPATFSAEAFIGPPVIEDDGPHLLFKHPDIELRLRGGHRLDFQTVGEFHTLPRSLHRWVQLIRALSHLTGTRGSSISIHDLERFPPVSFPLAEPLKGPDYQLPHLSTFLEGWQRLLEMAGVSSTAEFNLEQIWAADGANVAVDVLLNSARTSSFEAPDSPSLSQLPDQFEALYYDSAILGDASISFAARITIERTTDPVSRYRSTSAEILDVRPQVEDIKEYGEAQGTAHNIRAAMDPTNIQWIQRSSADEHPMALPTSE
ncbi:MAG TPA: hypothetical protein VI653_06960 [Steroidobacteraceae bacterium]